MSKLPLYDYKKGYDEGYEQGKKDEKERILKIVWGLKDLELSTLIKELMKE